jgi:formylglycine-generating enzyme required for sulfatase activity
VHSDKEYGFLRDGGKDEKPVHEVCVGDFYLGKYEVTQCQWKKVMGNNPSHFKDCGENCPVENVSWDDVQDYIRKLNKKTRHIYKLPTEAEWEYAARSGGKREKYSGGDNVDSVAWYDSNSDNKTHPAGTKSQNGLGIYDMSGNVWEWCEDWYDEGYYRNSPRNDPTGPSSGEGRVIRGGSWDFYARVARSAVRGNRPPDLRSDRLGFRLVRSN